MITNNISGNWLLVDYFKKVMDYVINYISNWLLYNTEPLIQETGFLQYHLQMAAFSSRMRSFASLLGWGLELLCASHTIASVEAKSMPLAITASSAERGTANRFGISWWQTVPQWGKTHWGKIHWGIVWHIVRLVSSARAPKTGARLNEARAQEWTIYFYWKLLDLWNLIFIR